MSAIKPPAGPIEDPGSGPSPAHPETEDPRDTGSRTRLKDAKATLEETKRSFLQRAEKESQRHGSVRAVFRLIDEDSARGGGLLSGGLAYRLFIWMLPAGLVATSLVQLFADADNASPAETAKGLGMGAALAATVGKAAAQSGRAAPALLVIGLVLMLGASRAVLKALRLVSSLAWSIPRTPLGSKTRSSLAAGGVLLLLSAYGFLMTPLYRGSLGTDIVATLVATLGLVAIATWGAQVLPHPDGIRWFAFVPGAVLVAIGVEALRLATAVYFAGKLDRVDDLYGAVGFAAVFMTYLYLLARLMVLGLITNAVAHDVGRNS